MQRKLQQAWLPAAAAAANCRGERARRVSCTLVEVCRVRTCVGGEPRVLAVGLESKRCLLKSKHPLCHQVLWQGTTESFGAYEAGGSGGGRAPKVLGGGDSEDSGFGNWGCAAGLVGRLLHCTFPAEQRALQLPCNAAHYAVQQVR